MTLYHECLGCEEKRPEDEVCNLILDLWICEDCVRSCNADFAKRGRVKREKDGSPRKT
jgi:hypothetical protein